MTATLVVNILFYDDLVWYKLVSASQPKSPQCKTKEPWAPGKTYNYTTIPL